MKLIVCVVLFACHLTSIRSDEVAENEIIPPLENKSVEEVLPADIAAEQPEVVPEDDTTIYQNRQMEVFELFQYVYHPYSPMAYSVDYDLQKNLDSYDESAGENFWNAYTYYTVPVDQIFSISSDEHLAIASALFKLFYYAKTWDIFIQTAKWARYSLNTDLFVFAFTAAVGQRSDCNSMIIPVAYEVNPYHYFTSDIIQAAENYKICNEINDTSKYHYVYSDYTKYFKYFNGDEGKLAHFTNDIALNAYYYNFQLDYGNWLDSTFTGERRGEKYFYVHQQLIARYNLERLANGLDLVSPIDFDEQVSDGGFNSYLRYANGLSFPSRANDWNSYDDVNILHRIEERIYQAIDKGYFETDDREIVNLTSPADIEILANLLQSTDVSQNSRYFNTYENYAKRILSSSVFFYKQRMILPGVLEQPETSLREPLFYRFYERLLEPYYYFQSMMPQYTTEELEFPGVRIISIDSSRLETYSTRLSIYLNNVVTTKNNGDDDTIFTKNNQHDFDIFDINVTISSSKSQSAVLKIFIGPGNGYDGERLLFDDMQHLWFELDNARIELVEGENIIQKSSNDFKQFRNDRTSFHLIYKIAKKNRGILLVIEKEEFLQGMPKRFILPKGRYEGFDVQFYFIVYPNESEDGGNFNNLPYGWPFDRTVFNGAVLDNNMIYSAKVFLRQ